MRIGGSITASNVDVRIYGCSMLLDDSFRAELEDEDIWEAVLRRQVWI